ncbi:MAG TPA: hypothetical protein VG963_30640 [Polyangiaceae bacterium]|nr:hypothetical protein [Polyangiaceae bacterium]
MPAPASAPTWNIEQLRFPKTLDEDARSPALQARLRASCRKLWEGGAIQVPWVAWSEPLAAALATAQREGQLAQGIEQAERALAREARGLSLADARSSTERGSRVSRLVLASNDGTERFYRQIEHLLRTYGPRVLAIRLDADSGCLSGVMDKPGGLARALLVEHKNSVARVLLALCHET